MPKQCPNCDLKEKFDGLCSRIIRFGSYYRTSDAKTVGRFRCLNCKKTFSNATFSDCFRQKKRHKNEILRRLLASGCSLRRSAKILNLHRTTVVRKFLFLGGRAEFGLALHNFEQPRANAFDFDDLETFEHSKCKPLSITLAVESPSRRILGFRVSEMRAKGLLTKKAKRYEPRADGRTKARRALFQEIQVLVVDEVKIRSDKNPHYEKDVHRFFPKAHYQQFKGKRGANTGQGELKKTKFDPLFSLNHTCAKMRADVNRLFRRTWCTTKRRERLQLHLAIFADFHNQQLAKTA